MLKNKNVLIGVTGSIAAYKIAYLVSSLKKLNCNVNVIMTQNAENFITPITFETLSGNKCITNTFDRNFEFNVEHVSLAKSADIFMVAPATANVIGKLASGIADDMLTTTFLACTCKKIVVPAMNTNMYTNPILQDNLKKLESYGVEIIKPISGHLACGDIGEGKMPEPSDLLEYILRDIAYKKDMEGLNVCITAGATREALDPVRFLTNNSTGKMGYALAKNAMLRGANVTLISGKTSLPPVPFVKIINVTSAEDMYNAVMEASKTADIIVKAAAVADYRPSTVSDEKIKKSDSDMSIQLERTKDILASLGQIKNRNFYLCGFSMETSNMIENSKKKLEKKNLDMIVANNLKVDGAGFGTDTNVVTIITKDSLQELTIMSKFDVAGSVFDEILKKIK